MKQYRLNIDGKEVLGVPGQTILEVARENDISIPTLCYDERTTIYGACGLCVVEVEGNPKLVKACARPTWSCCSPTTWATAAPPACSTARRAPTARAMWA